MSKNRDKDDQGMHEGPVVVTDKRIKHDTAPMTAEELLAQGNEEQRKQQEAQELLAQQAAAENERPDASTQYQGGGLKGEPEGLPEVGCIAAFVVLLHHDGTAAAGPLDMEYLARVVPTREVNASDMFKACAEVQKDIQAGDTAMAVVNYMQQASTAMAQQRMAAQQAQSGLKRGR